MLDCRFAMLCGCAIAVLCQWASLFAMPRMSWIEGRAEGWAWYEERGLEEEEQATDSQPLTSTQQMEQVRAELEEALSTALLQPTEENVVAYMELQQKWVDQSARFAGEWALALLQYPGLDHTASQVPASQYGLQLHNRLLLQRREALISSLVVEHGLFFFYRGEDPASAAFHQVIRQLEKKYDWAVLAISVDGVELDGLPFRRKDNGISEAFGVEVLPALYVVSPTENMATPVSFGLTSIDQIEQNIYLQFSEEGE